MNTGLQWPEGVDTEQLLFASLTYEQRGWLWAEKG